MTTEKEHAPSLLVIMPFEMMVYEEPTSVSHTK